MDEPCGIIRRDRTRQPCTQFIHLRNVPDARRRILLRPSGYLPREVVPWLAEVPQPKGRIVDTVKSRERGVHTVKHRGTLLPAQIRHPALQEYATGDM